MRVHYWEEPVFKEIGRRELSVNYVGDGIRILTPILPLGRSSQEDLVAQRELLDSYIVSERIIRVISWYYTPMALLFSDHLNSLTTIYDCMDELSAFQGAPSGLIQQEQRLFERADVVFAGGASLYSVKRSQHKNVHLFPSSIDSKHFATAMLANDDPKDQKDLAHPRIGFYGVLDERLDQPLLCEIAAIRPEWHFILIGPVVKISERHLPQGSNIHYLGFKSYDSLPNYLGGWDVAMQPFAKNASTKFISPTKTPEYLASGRPVVSTSIRDVVRPYGELGLVEIADDPISFIKAIERALASDEGHRRTKAREFLADKSWDKTFEAMWREIQSCVRRDSVSDSMVETGMGDSHV